MSKTDITNEIETISQPQETDVSDSTVNKEKLNLTPKMRWALRLVIVGGLVMLIGMGFVIFTIAKRLSGAEANNQKIEMIKQSVTVSGELGNLISANKNDDQLSLMYKQENGQYLLHIINLKTGMAVEEIVIKTQK